MEYRKLPSQPILNSGAAFFEKLNNAGIRYGVFKSSRNTAPALAGDQDLDLLVAREDYRGFCGIAAECDGIRSVNHRSLVSPGREDWFIPDFERAKYLHLDVHTEVRLGGKFDKRYPCYRYDDVKDWHRVKFGTCSIPVVGAEEEARITLSRIAFREGGGIFGGWNRLKGDWAQELDELLFSFVPSGEKAVAYTVDGRELQCRVRKEGGGIFVCGRDLANIRRFVKTRCSAPRISMISDPIRNAFSTALYAMDWVRRRVRPGSVVDRRRPVSGGLLVSLIAPDGMGKTTQVKRMSRLFGWKFSCTTLYLGSGDGKGWWLRRFIRASYVRRRSSVKELLADKPEGGEKPRSIAGRAASLMYALWGVLVALERYAGVRAGTRMAVRGLIVFCDRWPQSIEAGLMDGPTKPRSGYAEAWLRRWELLLYQRMGRYQPDVTIHLTGDYATSAARKPGELTREEFDKRIALMAECRHRDQNIHVIDASGDIDEVSRALFKLIWGRL